MDILKNIHGKIIYHGFNISLIILLCKLHVPIHSKKSSWV